MTPSLWSIIRPMGDLPNSTRALLLEIARCPEIEKCLVDPKHSSPCRAIIGHQETSEAHSHQPAEPWSGNLLTASILFISSNPSISDEDMFPPWGTDDDTMVAYFESRFVGFIRDGKYALRWDEEWDDVQRFWAGARNMASEILERTSATRR